MMSLMVTLSFSQLDKVGTGTTPGDGTGDPMYVAFSKVNAAIDSLLQMMEDLGVLEEKNDSIRMDGLSGSIFVKNGNKWVALDPASEGYFLESGALPSWSSINDAVAAAPSVVENETKLDSFSLAADDGAILIKQSGKWLGLAPSSSGYFLESGALPSWSSINDAVATAPSVVANTAKRTYPSADETKLSGIEDNATGDQTGSEIISLVNAQVERQLKESLDTIFARFHFYIDSVVTNGLLMADSIQIKNDANVIKKTNSYSAKSYESAVYETFNLEEMEWDTIFFKDGTKLWTGEE